VLFTSGATGLPKDSVHGHDEVTLEGLRWPGLYYTSPARTCTPWPPGTTAVPDVPDVPVDALLRVLAGHIDVAAEPKPACLTGRKTDGSKPS
jgi:hypothetical protein